MKENQKLHKGSVEIEGDSATLADKNIFPGDVLWVSDSEIHENRDIAGTKEPLAGNLSETIDPFMRKKPIFLRLSDELSEQKLESHQTEEGFRGTLLLSDVSIQVLLEI